MEFLLQGILLGLAYVAPIGMQNMFVINSALNSTRRRVILTVLTVIFFDMTLASACYFGIGLLMESYAWLKIFVLNVGSLVIIYIGLQLWRTRPAEMSGDVGALPFKKMIISAGVVTWCNPQAIIDGTMLLGAVRATLTEAAGYNFLLGVIGASWLWFSVLALAVSVFKNFFSREVLLWLNRICAVVIIFYGGKLLMAGLELLF